MLLAEKLIQLGFSELPDSVSVGLGDKMTLWSGNRNLADVMCTAFVSRALEGEFGEIQPNVTHWNRLLHGFMAEHKHPLALLILIVLSKVRKSIR